MDVSCLPMEEIFVRLPTSSLVRLQQVCKLWRNIIQEPSFIEAHRERACKVYATGKVVCCWREQRFEILDEALRPQMQKTWSMEGSARIVGSCNGLVCIYTQSEGTNLEMAIANPTTGEYLTLPKPSARNYWEFFDFCFGYHPVTKQYKVTHLNLKHDIKEVYTLGDSSWRPINCQSLTDYGDLQQSLSVNGTTYLSTRAYESANHPDGSGNQCIFSFDLKDETLTKLCLPSQKLEEGNKLIYHRRMTIIEGSPCLVTKSYYSSDRTRIRLDIWTLESPQEHRWSHMCSIRLYGVRPIEPIFIHGKKILVIRFVDSNTKVKLWYHEVDLKGNNCIEWEQVVKLEHSNCYDFYENWVQSFDYIATLVPLYIYGDLQRKK